MEMVISLDTRVVPLSNVHLITGVVNLLQTLFSLIFLFLVLIFFWFAFIIQGCASVHLLTGLLNQLGNLEELVIRDVLEVIPFFHNCFFIFRSLFHIYISYLHLNYQLDFQVTIHPMLYSSKGHNRNLGARLETIEISRAQRLEVSQLILLKFSFSQPWR